MMEIASGNQSDKARFAGLLGEFKQKWTFEGLCIADGALYSADNIKIMTNLQWLTRVPLSIKEASTLVNEVGELKPSTVKGYKLTESSSEYGGVPQRWILIESEQRRKSDLKRLAQKIEQYQQKSQQELKKLSAQEFACIADAINAAQKLSKRLTWHELSDIQTVEKRHYRKAGKPSKNDVPNRICYRVTAIVSPIESEIGTQNIRCGRFILATNVLDSEKLSADKALREYKAQQGVERGFRFLKDPLFFASSVFLKSPKRISAQRVRADRRRKRRLEGVSLRGMIMSLCLLVYNLGQRQLRQALAASAKTIPNQLGKPTDTPTLRWVFQCFMAVHLVVYQGVQQVVNLTDERRHILQFFSESCRRYYFLPVPDS